MTTDAPPSTTAMGWDSLVCADRLETADDNPDDLRTAFERDFDRILFSTPARRLGDKTQVFPRDGRASTRNRLTHSHEASTLGRAAAATLAERLELGPELRSSLSAIAASAALGHDLGTPPFAHAGERAIKQWFERLKEQQPKLFEDLSQEQTTDFLKFDANAQTIRIVLKLQAGVRYDGFNLTPATIMALVKYPPTGPYGKLGCFSSEIEILDKARERCAIPRGARHPLTFIMESCDDIAYAVHDIEDSIRKGIVSGLDVIDHIERTVETSGSRKIVRHLRDDWAKLHRRHWGDAALSDHDYAEVIAQRFRCRMIPPLLEYALRAFIENKDEIMRGQFSKDLLHVKEDGKALLDGIKDLALNRAYRHVGVLELEARGTEAISALMSVFLLAIQAHALEKPMPSSFEALVWRKISSTYRSQFMRTNRTPFDQFRLLTDMVAGMTDGFALELHEELRALRPSGT